MADLIAAVVAREGAVTGGTHESQVRWWGQFWEYATLIVLY